MLPVRISLVSVIINMLPFILPNEYVAYTHLPRVSEGGIDTNIDDVPKFRVPGLMRGNIYMGTQLNSERYTFKSGYRTQFDYRINIDELMHGVFTGCIQIRKDSSCNALHS